MTDERDAGETSEKPGGGGNPAEQVIARFGGLRPMASKMGLAVSTVQGWKNRGHIPLSRHEEIRAAARKHEIELDETELTRAGGEARDPAESTTSLPEEEPATTATETSRTTEDVWRNRDPASTESAGTTTEGAKSEPRTETSAQRSGSFVPAMLIGALLLIFGAGAAVLGREAWLPLVDPEAAGTAQQTAERLTAIDDRLERMEANASGLTPDDLKPLQTQLEGLDERLAELANQVEQVSRSASQEQDSLDSLGEDISQLSARLDDISGNLPGGEVWQSQMAELEGQLSQLSEAATQIAPGRSPRPRRHLPWDSCARLCCRRAPTARNWRRSGACRAMTPP
ncbi:carph-isopro domain-containing protein [Fodinicurvata halophila]|uniref:carph-isopro domain-containing protein n=1 Tax=Fodinicurvata halophila TaxID=1419723 RepID=UPI00362D37BE